MMELHRGLSSSSGPREHASSGAEGSEAPESGGSGVGPDPQTGGETILVVDDDRSVLQVASKVLRRGGYRVLEANGGAEALLVAEENDGHIALLLTDVVMPGMNGRELSEALTARYPGVRVLFMSAYTEDEVILHGVRVAEVNFVSKPFTIAGLRARVREVLDQRTSN